MLIGYEKIKHLKPGKFKRFCGVRPETFEKMVELVHQHNQQKLKTGRPGKLTPEDQVFMTLQYGREYRTYFHIGQCWGVTESTACRIIRKIETILSQSGEFKLPGKKQLSSQDSLIKVIVMDVTETPIERPKKNKNNSIVVRKKDTLLNPY